MKKLFFCLIFFSSLMIISSCSKEDEEGTVELFIEVPAEGGVDLKGQHDLGQVKEQGFYLSGTPDPGESNGIRIPAAGQFSATVNEGLLYNSQYYVRAYVRTGSGYVYSKAQSFVSLGGKAPVITDIPNGILGEQVTISGKHLLATIMKTQVKFDEVIAHITEKTDSTITVRVPGNLKRFDPEVTVQIYEKTGVYKDFQLHTPVITGASASEVSLGDTLIIYGEHFDKDYDRLKSFEGSSSLKVLTIYNDSLKLVLPLEAESSTLDLQVPTQLQLARFSGLKVRKPVIESFPKNIRAYDTLSFNGKFFSPVREANRIYFGPHQAEVLSASAEKIKLRVPLGPYEDHYPEVRYELMDYSLEPKGVRLTDKFLLKMVGPAGTTSRGGHFVVDEIGYFVEKVEWNSYVNFLSFDPVTNTYSEFDVKVPEPKLRDVLFSAAYNKNSGRIFFHFETETDNFYEFHLESRSFTKLADVPGMLSLNPAFFSINDKVYKSLGRDPESYSYSVPEREDSLRHTYSYDVFSDQWARQQDFPRQGRRWIIPAYVDGDDAFIGNSTHTSVEGDFWKYNGRTNTWAHTKKFPWWTYGTAFFSHKGTGYTYYGFLEREEPDKNSFRHDASTDNWKPVESVNDRFFTYFTPPSGAFSLEFRDRIFVVLEKYPVKYFFEADLENF